MSHERASEPPADVELGEHQATFRGNFGHFGAVVHLVDFDNRQRQFKASRVFGAIGGCGALLSKCIKKAEVVAYDDWGAEAIRRLEVENFPAVVIIDSLGNNLYETGRANYLEQKK